MTDPELKKRNLDLLHLSAKTVADIASSFDYLTTNGEVRVEELSPLVLHSLYLAICFIQRELINRRLKILGLLTPSTPRRANSRAIALPIPLDPPVTRAIFSSSVFIVITFNVARIRKDTD